MSADTLTTCDTLRAIARIYEDNTDDGGEWDSNEIAEAVAALLIETGWAKSCPEHEMYPAEMDTCPRCDRHTLESCTCGECFDCPDGWHRGADLPCSCTADCALNDEGGDDD